MILEVKKYKNKEIADWFGITKESFSRSRDKKLQELSLYCDWVDLGRQGIKITAVRVPEYLGKAKKIVEDTMGTIRSDVEVLKDNQKTMTSKIDNILNKTQKLNKELEHQKQVSQTCDYLLIKALRKKGVINGDSEVIIELLMKDGNLLLNEDGGANGK